MGMNGSSGLKAVAAYFGQFQTLTTRICLEQSGHSNSAVDFDLHIAQRT